jgi:hypothetical protein
MFRGGQPYSEFRSVNSKDGRIRFEADPFGVTLVVDDATLTANRKVYVCDASGSAVVKGYHIIFGSTTISGTGTTLSLVPVGDFMKVSVALTGARTTSIVLANVYSTAGAGAAIAVAAARCTTANYLEVLLTNITAATVANGTLSINYAVLNP